MESIEKIKRSVAELYERGGNIQISVNSTRPRIHVDAAEATITGVYRNLFTVDTVENGLKKTYSIQYTDLLIGKISIK